MNLSENMLLTGEGKVLNDPEIRSFEEGNKLLKFLLSFETWGANHSVQTNTIGCDYFGKDADQIKEKLKKGDSIKIKAQLAINKNRKDPNDKRIFPTLRIREILEYGSNERDF